MPYHRNVDVVELEVKRADGVVVMKSHQVQRDARRGGKTTGAAVRLALWRLVKFMSDQGLACVDEVVVRYNQTGDDFIRNQRTVRAETACLDRLEMDALGIELTFRVPSGSRSIRVPMRPPPEVKFDPGWM